MKELIRIAYIKGETWQVIQGFTVLYEGSLANCEDYFNSKVNGVITP